MEQRKVAVTRLSSQNGQPSQRFVPFMFGRWVRTPLTGFADQNLPPPPGPKSGGG